jgi:hypothetical protein
MALKSANPDERWAAARAAVPGNENVLAAALHVETDRRVREAMFSALARSAQGTDAILSFLRSDDAGFRAGAIDALRSSVDAIRAHLPQLLSDADSDVRLLSCELVRSLPNDEATRILSGVLARENEMNVCAAAIDVLAEAGRPEALPALAACEARFKDTPFLAFAIEVARERILSQSTAPHG